MVSQENTGKQRNGSHSSVHPSFRVLQRPGVRIFSFEIKRFFSFIPCEYFPVSVFFYILCDFIIEKALETLA